MAMLDPRMFDPQSYAPFAPQMPNFGLLNIPQSPGFPEMTQEMSARTAPMNITPELPPQPAPQQSPGFFGALSNGLANNSNTLLALGAGIMSGGYGEGLKNALVGSKLDREQRTINQTEQALQARGLSPDIARVVAGNPTLLAGVLQESLGIKQRTDKIKEFEYAKSQGFKGSFTDYIASQRAGAGEYSLTPVYGKDAQGNTVLIQPGKTGTAIQTKIPEGITISSGVEKVDLGTQWGIMDKRTGNIVGYQPKDVAGKASAEEFGKGQGQARLILPQTKTAVDSAFRVIGELRNHPGIDAGTGLSSVIDPRSWVPGQPGYDFQALNEQAQGKAFMAAREALKGAGQVTDFEGAKGEQAIANLKTAQSKAQYLKALDELERMLKASYADLQKKAGAQAQPQSSTSQADPLGIR